MALASKVEAFGQVKNLHNQFLIDSKMRNAFVYGFFPGKQWKEQKNWR
jgi:hypothetical protein